MSEAEPPRIVAAIEDEEQRAAMLAAATQLSACVGDALGGDWPVRLRLVAPDEAEIPSGVVLVATIAARGTDEAPDAVEARWRDRIARYRTRGHERILLCNLARQAGAPVPAPVEMARLRRLRRSVITLSRDLGVEVVDAERLLALCGLRRIAADPRGPGVAAADLIGHAVVDAILQGDLGEGMDPALQARASQHHGGVRDIPRLVARRIQPGARP